MRQHCACANSVCGRPISFPEPTCLLVSTKTRRSGARFSKLPVITALVKLRVSDESFKRFQNCTVKLSAKETKWTSLEVRKHPTFLETSISKYDFGPVKFPGLSRNGPLDQLPETKILGLLASRRMRGLVYIYLEINSMWILCTKAFNTHLKNLESRNLALKVQQYQLFKSKRQEGSGNELVDYSRAPCLGADQKACGLWERDWLPPFRANISLLCLVNIFSNNLLYSTLAFLTTTRMSVRGRKHLDRKRKAAVALEV